MRSVSLPHLLRSRIAPTPSGLLHPGNAVNFILIWAISRAFDGKILLRIDDLDKARCRDAYLDDIFHTLNWLGIDYDEGPEGIDDFKANWSQHQRLPLYDKALGELKSAGYLFACNCSRKTIARQSVDGSYPNNCQKKLLPFDEKNVSWRVQAPFSGQKLFPLDWIDGQQEITVDAVDAFNVRQKNGFPAYQLASLVDDQYFNINFIVRGQDLWSSTLSQLYLAGLLQSGDFSQTQFFHHPLLLNADGEKLSKSKGAGSLLDWRKNNIPATTLFQKASMLLHLPEHYSNGLDLVKAIKNSYRQN